MLRNIIVPLALFITIFGALYLSFGDIVLQPNRFMLNGLSDGLKNYYTPTYYIQNDNGWWFTGLNYPYGEHVVYTDNQPIVSAVLNFIDNNIVSIGKYTVGIINSLMFLSLWLCAFFLFLILNKHLGLPQFYSFLFSVLITLLSPQIARMTGHYALAYSCYIPILWYYLIKMQESKNMLGGMLSLLVICVFFGFIHLYFLLIGTLFLLAYWFIFALENRKSFSKVKKRSAFLLIAALAPLVIARLFIAMTDPVIDRPTAPWGFLFYRSFLETVFLPVYGPVKALILKVYAYKTDRAEGHAYIGLIGLMIALFTLGRQILKLFKGDFRLQFTQHRELNRSLKAAILVLLFSMGIPFIWGMEFLLELLPPLKQFRSLGRFAWVFFYVFSVFTAYTIYLWFRRFTIKNKPVLATALVIGVICGWAVEDAIHLRETNRRFQPVENYFSNTSIDIIKTLEDQGYTTDEFQAILAVPYFHIGSEKLGIHRDGIAFVKAAQVSQQTGLPLIQSHLSRASTSQTTKAVQLLSDTLIPKEILKELPNDKPLLLVVANKVYFPNESYLISKAKLIYQKDNLRLLELPLSTFKTTLSNESLPADYQKPVYWDSFEETPQKHTLSGTGGFYKKEGNVELLNWKLPQETSLMELSFWVHVEHTVYGMPEVEVQHIKNDSIISDTRINTQILTDVYTDWLKVTAEFKVKPELDHLKVVLHGGTFWVDDLQIRKKNVDTYINVGKSVKKNNYTITD